MGFKRCVLPADNRKHLKPPADMKVIGINTISELPDILF
jgi:hypothetical protein